MSGKARGGSARDRRSQRRAIERETAGVDKAPSPALDPFNTRDKVRLALMAAGEVEPAIETTYELTAGSLVQREFYAQALRAGLRETRRAAWPSEAALEDHGTVLFRDGDSAVFDIDGTIVYAEAGGGWLYMRVASGSRDTAADIVEEFSAKYPPLYRDQDESGTVPITFWTNGKFGPVSRLRMIESATMPDIARNYTASVRDELERLATAFEPGKDGQLLLWQGPPGTGKTWALRALASAWSEWAEFSYITDPDAFFVTDPSYMIDVLLHDSYETLTVTDDVVTDAKPEGKWRVLILEDTGELLSANAKDAYGQGLSRLLNVVDGMVGQGLRVLALVTTNDELGDLHPAVTRPGRCASQIVFGPLTPDEATAWLADTMTGEDAAALEALDRPVTLAELYAVAGEEGEPFAFAGACATCDHDATMHAGAENDGACSYDGCDCTSFAEDMEDDDAADEAAVTASSFGDVPAGTIVNVQGVNTLVYDPTPNSVSSTLRVELTDVEVTPIIADVGEPVDGVQVREPVLTGAHRWTAVLAPEGKATDDGRIFAPGAIEWRELPLSLMAMVETQDGHDGAQVCGRIDRIWRDEEAGVIRGEGEFDSGDYGAEIARMVGEETLRGVSVDLAISEMEIAYRDEVVDADGRWIRQDDGEQEEGDGPSMEEVMFGGEQEVIFVVQSAVLGTATVCPFPAFADATIEVAASLVASSQAPMVWTATGQAGWIVAKAPRSAQEPAGRDETPDGDTTPGLTASAAGIAPEAPPAEWFDEPEFDELTPLTVTDDGRVYGHVAPWGECHVGIPGVCTTAPESNSDYAYFHLKEVVLDDGSRVACGTITLDAPHADRNLGRAAASSHYDNTGTAVADVVCGEDEYGIWITGALRADVDADKARRLRGAALSGDWRDVNGNLEMIGVLAVNVPGFPIPRTRALVASTSEGPRVLSLTAAGVHVDGKVSGFTPRAPLFTPEQAAQLEAMRDIAAGTYDQLAADAA